MSDDNDNLRQPRVGDMTHYVSYGTPRGEYISECRAAIVTEILDPEAIPMTAWDQVEQGTVGLCVLNPAGMFFNRRIRHSADIQAGTWHWPSTCS